MNNEGWAPHAAALPRTIVAPGNITVELLLRQGLNVDWTFKVYAQLSLECLGDGPLRVGP